MKTEQKPFTPLVIIQVAFFIIIVPFLPLLISWNWKWWEAWVYLIIYIAGFTCSRILAAKRHPDLLSERARFMRHENTMSWDKILAPIAGIGSGMIPLIAGLDARYAWSPTFSMPIKIVSLVVILAGYFIGSYALIENRFFSGTVRIQTDRNHKVVSSGPYRWIRHPGYSGALLTFLASPVFLDANWAFLPAAFVTILLIIRTKLEDSTLQTHLEGYHDYAMKTRYRLIPGIW
ncbi:methyltransferase family protein [Bacteroidota bacterium]